MQAVIIASICEFLGAVLLGASVTDTIKSGIAKASYFRATPELLMFGMFCVRPGLIMLNTALCFDGNNKY